MPLLFLVALFVRDLDVSIDSPRSLMRHESESVEGDLELRSLAGGLSTASMLHVFSAVAGGDLPAAVQQFASQVEQLSKLAPRLG